MDKPNEHGFCPNCGLNFDGGDIKQEFISQGKSEEEAHKLVTECYGYGPGRTQWSRKIGIYDVHKDRTVYEICPNCKEIVK